MTTNLEVLALLHHRNIESQVSSAASDVLNN